MNEFYKMDVFFFLTSVAVVVIAVLIAILLMYLIRISRDINAISKKARAEADLISEDLSQLRSDIRRDGAKLKFFASFFNRLAQKSKTNARK